MTRMKTFIYCQCGAKTTPRKRMAEGWLTCTITYNDGNKWASYTCRDCRNKHNTAAQMAPSAPSVPSVVKTP